MSSFVVPLSRAAARFEQLGKEMQVVVFQGLIAAGAHGLRVLVIEILPSRIPQPVDRGVFRAGWKLRVGPDYVEIYNDEAHAIFIEEGVRGSNVKPGRAMLEALASWALRKGLASDAKEATSIAWAIARSMQKKGIFVGRGPYKEGLGLLKQLVDWRLDGIIETEVLRALGQL